MCFKFVKNASFDGHQWHSRVNGDQITVMLAWGMIGQHISVKKTQGQGLSSYALDSCASSERNYYPAIVYYLYLPASL